MSRTILPVHPVTGLQALGFTKRGPIWPVIGGSEDHDTQEVSVEPEDTESGDQERDVFDEARAKQALAKKNSENVNLRKRLKELEAAASKLKELEDKDKTETQRLTEDRDGYKSRADKAETALRKFQVALDAAPEGATLAQVRAVAKRLSGDTDEDLAADAEELYSLLGTAKPEPKTPPVTGKPQERLRGGGDPDEEVEETDPRKLAELIRRH